MQHDDDSSGDELDGLQSLLGGICLEDIAASSWIMEENGNLAIASRDLHSSSRLESTTVSLAAKFPTKTPPKDVVELAQQHRFFQWAHYVADNGRIEDRPPVKVVESLSRGRSLIASQFIPKGSVLYTERAAVPTQVSFNIKACQYCFRSLEPVSKLSAFLPMPELWPVPEWEFDSSEPLDGSFRIDRYGRVVCGLCDSHFCSRTCCKCLQQLLGSCCHIRSVCEQLTNDEDPAIHLAVRLLAFKLQHHRSTKSPQNDDTLVDWLCGESSDLTELELGDRIVVDDHIVHYSLQSVYDTLSETIIMTKEEKSVLPLNYFHALAAKAARNGVNISTQSPFNTYYNAILRDSCGRGSLSHERLKIQIGHALGSKNGALERGMDRAVDGRVTPQLVAIFPLTAMINHSCAPNAQIRGQEFVDCHIDLTALHDIKAGEEISISYLPTGHGVGEKRRHKRQRELQAKYLFICDCIKCSNHEGL